MGSQRLQRELLMLIVTFRWGCALFFFFFLMTGPPPRSPLFPYPPLSRSGGGGAPPPDFLHFALLQAGQQCLSLVRPGPCFPVLLKNLKPPLTLKPLAGGTGGMGTGKYGA